MLRVATSGLCYLVIANKYDETPQSGLAQASDSHSTSSQLPVFLGGQNPRRLLPSRGTLDPESRRLLLPQ
jgi:hypothetical protein